MKAPQVLADGWVPLGSGRLKIRRRETASAVVTEWLFIWTNVDDKLCTMTLGRFSAAEKEGFLTIKQARALALQLQDEVKSGIDPAHKREIETATRKREQAAAVVKVREAKEKTLQALMDGYVAALEAKGKRESAYDVKNMFKNHVTTPFPEMSEMPAAHVMPEHVSKILVRLVGPEVAKAKGRTALKLRSYLSSAFKMAMGASLDPMAHAAVGGFDLTLNPAAAVPSTSMAAKFNRAGHRTLSVPELRAYLTRLEAVPSMRNRLALQLQIMAGGQRLQQLLRLTHADIGADTFTLFDGKGKRAQPRPHVLPLLPELSGLIEELKVLAAAEVEEVTPATSLFSSRGGAAINPETLSGVVKEISDAMVTAKEAATPFRGGDIRRTCETMLAERLGVSKDTRAQLLSHGISGVQDVHYDKGGHLAAKTNALKVWIAFLKAVRNGEKLADNVVPFAADAEPGKLRAVASA